jgi:hypothetical protein
MFCNIILVGKVGLEKCNIPEKINLRVKMRILPFSCFGSPHFLFYPTVKKGFPQHIFRFKKFLQSQRLLSGAGYLFRRTFGAYNWMPFQLLILRSNSRSLTPINLYLHTEMLTMILIRRTLLLWCEGRFEINISILRYLLQIAGAIQEFNVIPSMHDCSS